MGATAGFALQASSLFANVSAQRQQASSARAQGEYSGAIADRNAGLADAQAADALSRGEQMVGRIRQGTRQLVGAQRAAMAAQGIDVNSGTPLDLQGDSNTLSAFDQLTAKNNAAREAWGFNVDAANQRAAGANARLAGENEGKALTAKSYSTLLTGSAGLADQWRQNPPSFGSTGAWWRNRRNGGVQSGGSGAGQE
jgi:uncharacterized protein YcbX